MLSNYDQVYACQTPVVGAETSVMVVAEWLSIGAIYRIYLRGSVDQQWYYYVSLKGSNEPLDLQQF